MRQILEDQVSNLRNSGVADSVIGEGSIAPNFVLPDHLGAQWELASALQSGPVVLKFYRGSWCPYCNLELRAYQLQLPRIRERGASFVAVSPEKRDFAQGFITEEKLEFPVLSDYGNTVARKFGLEFTLDEQVRDLMKELGNDLNVKNDEDRWTLPIPGIFVISTGGRIEYSFAEPDFTLRADPNTVLEALDKLRGSLHSPFENGRLEGGS